MPNSNLMIDKHLYLNSMQLRSTRVKKIHLHAQNTLIIIGLVANMIESTYATIWWAQKNKFNLILKDIYMSSTTWRLDAWFGYANYLILQEGGAYRNVFKDTLLGNVGLEHISHMT